MPHEMIVIGNTEGGVQKNDLGAGIREKRFFHIKEGGQITNDTGLVIYYNDQNEIIGHRKPMGEKYSIAESTEEIEKALATDLWTDVTIPYLQSDETLSIDPLEDHILLDESGTVRTQYGLTTNPDQRFPTDDLRSQLAGDINNIKIPRIDDKGDLYLSDKCDKLYETDDLLFDEVSLPHQSQILLYHSNVAAHLTEVTTVRSNISELIGKKQYQQLGNYIYNIGISHPAAQEAVLSSTYDF